MKKFLVLVLLMLTARQLNAKEVECEKDYEDVWEGYGWKKTCFLEDLSSY